MRIILIVAHDAFRQAPGASGFFGGAVNRATAEPFSRTDSTVRRLRSKRRDSGGWVPPPPQRRAHWLIQRERPADMTLQPCSAPLPIDACLRRPVTSINQAVRAAQRHVS
jgi:hypothetical protein